MRLLLATASVDEIRWASASGLLDGVLTTPALLSAAGGDERELLTDICRATAGPVFVSVHAVDRDDLYRDARELAKLSDRIVVQVPLIEEAIGSVCRLAGDGVRVAATLVFNAAQGLLAAKAGAGSVVASVDYLDQVGQSGVDLVRDLRHTFDASRTACDVIAVHPASAQSFAGCALAGADAIAVAPAVVRNLLVHPLTDRGIDLLLSDLSTLHGRCSTQ